MIDSEETLEDKALKQKSKEIEPEPEEKFIYKLVDCNVKKHEEAKFELKLPKPKTKVRWTKDGVPITEDNKFKIEVFILTFKKTKLNIIIKIFKYFHQSMLNQYVDL